MAAMKPRTGDGPMECPKEGRGYVLRVPLEGGGRLVVELNAQEVKDLGAVLKDTVSAMPKKQALPIFFGINKYRINKYRINKYGMNKLCLFEHKQNLPT